MLKGRPDSAIEPRAEVENLFLPLKSSRFLFSDICVEDGQSVEAGAVLARDPGNFDVPLLSPRAGIVKLQQADGHIVLTDIKPVADKPSAENNIPHAAHETGPVSTKRNELLMLGAWQYFYDANTGQLPDPKIEPQAIIISTLNLEPFAARGDAQLKNNLLRFTRGLEHLQSLLEYQPMYLILPGIKSDFAEKAHEQIRGYAWAKIIKVPLKYPFSNFKVLAKNIGLKASDGPVWALRAEGVLAVDRVMTKKLPVTSRVISIAGPTVESPKHLEITTGYPIEKIAESVSAENVRIINGGIFTGQKIESDQLGIDTECTGITVLEENTEREFLGFVRPGFDRKSYSNSYLSALRPAFAEPLNTALRGELRPCVSCNYCEQVCPMLTIPHLVHKFLYKDLLEEAEQAGLGLCIQCGLCSFVCPSKIDLAQQMAEAKQQIAIELHQEVASE